MENKQTPSWYAWAYGRELADMSDRDIQVYAQRVWNTSDVSQLMDFRAEAKRRGIECA